jgi:hypothetical protein
MENYTDVGRHQHLMTCVVTPKMTLDNVLAAIGREFYIDSSEDGGMLVL